MTDPGGEILKTVTSHDIGLITASKLVAIFWAGLLPLMLPLWLIIQGEIRYQNHIQDSETAQRYVTKEQYMEFQTVVRDLQLEVHKLRDAIEFSNLKDSGRK